MVTVAVFLPCGRDFDDFGFKVSQAILALKTDYEIKLYLGIKKSNYERSLLKNELINKVEWVFEPEHVRSCAQFFNAAYKITKEDYFIVFVDDYLITGNMFGIIDFIKDKEFPVATFGVCSDTPEHDNKPNEIAYYPHSVGHGGSKGAHPTFVATNIYGAKTDFMKKLFPNDLYEMERYYSDDFLAFKLQKKCNSIIPVWVGGAIRSTTTPALGFSPGYDAREEYKRYVYLVSRIEHNLQVLLL